MHHVRLSFWLFLAAFWLLASPSLAAFADTSTASCAAAESAVEASLKTEETIDAQIVVIQRPGVMFCHAPLEAAVRDFVADYIAESVRFGNDLTEAEREEWLGYASEALENGFAWTHDMSITQEFGNDRIISLLAGVWSYTGGAHGNLWFASLVYDVEGEKILELADLFEAEMPFLEAISAYVKEDLYRQKRQNGILSGDSADEDYFIEDGAAPEPENYLVFGFYGADDGVPRGLSFHFAPYYVGSFVEGDFHVDVPAAIFDAFLTEEARALFR